MNARATDIILKTHRMLVTATQPCCLIREEEPRVRSRPRRRDQLSRETRRIILHVVCGSFTRVFVLMG